MSTLSLKRRALLTSGAMCVSAFVGASMVPTRLLSKERGPFKLAEMIPESFAAWQPNRYAQGGVVNPQAQALSDRIYSQILDRAYLTAEGHHIMLSVAYSADQADTSTQVHYPEVCYPAQGFRVLSERRDQVATSHGPVRVKRLETRLPGRPEPLTYWTMVGNQQSLGGWDKKLAEIRHGLKGEIVDGLVFRVSCIDPDSQRAFELQDRFIRELEAVLSPGARLQLMGLRA